ncbi:MAG TPA: SDR family NAD(P)-dependent oxidoreductase [Bryobacteraceae bacterium]|nr:SDR family NAD(P)-dependent oxidoreductase [Bryobacteraceae bacterium]
MDLAGRVAVITGASRGLGKAMALALAPAGVRLALVARDVAKLTEVAEEARKLGAEAEVFQADIGNEGQVVQLEQQVSRVFGSVSILINNAGINIRKFCVEYTLEEWNSVLTTNLTSVFLMCRAFVPHMKGRGYGRVINITSIMAHISLPQRTVYCASKAGLLGFTRALALEHARDNITVVAISPGPFATEMTEGIINDPQKSEQFMSHTPMRRWGDPNDVGKLALFLCSKDASFITGTDMVIDGGWCAE